MRREGCVTACVAVTCIVSMWASPALAYIGPGTGIAAIGAFLALILGTIVAFFGFLWYPVKRLLRKKKVKEPPSREPQQEPEPSEKNGADS